MGIAIDDAVAASGSAIRRSDPGASTAVPAVEVAALVARYGSRTVLDGVDVAVQRGEIHVILGGSGSGKSTLLKHMIGLLEPSEGQVRLLGEDLQQGGERAREALLSRIGVLFQGGALLESLDIAGNVALPLSARTAAPAEVIAELVRIKLELVGLAGKGHLYPRELSGGMRKRAALARAIAADPEVLFCDEPGAGLDPISAAALDDLLRSLCERFGMAIVVISHELTSIRAIADRVTMLADGKVCAQGSLEAVQRVDHPFVRDFFGRARDAGSAAPSLWQRVRPDAAS